jgi:hypothetical protein
MPPLRLLQPRLAICLLALALCSTAAPLPFPFDSFLIQPPPPRLLADVDTAELVLDDAWAAPAAGRFSPLPELLPRAPVMLRIQRRRAEELIEFAQAQAIAPQGFTLFVQTCLQLLDDLPVLPTLLTPIGAYPNSFFPPSISPSGVAFVDGGSICFTSADLPLEDALQPLSLSLQCTGHAPHDTCEFSPQQLERLHLSATLDSDAAPPLFLHRIYASRTTLYARGAAEQGEQSDVLAHAPSVRYLSPVSTPPCAPPSQARVSSSSTAWPPS